MKTAIKKIFDLFGYNISKGSPTNYSNKIVSLKSSTTLKWNVLLSYLLEPFLLKDGQKIPNAHTHDLESYQIAETFLDLEFEVDIIDCRNTHYIPPKDYLVFISARTNFQGIAELLNTRLYKDCAP